jgi:hypothetical protein
MEFHGSGGAGFDAHIAGYAQVVVEADQMGLGVKLESVGRANSNTGTAMGAALFIAHDILAQGVYFDARRSEILDTLIVIGLFPAKLQHYQSFLVRYDGSLHDVEAEVIVLYQVENDRLVYNTAGKM